MVGARGKCRQPLFSDFGISPVLERGFGRGQAVEEEDDAGRRVDADCAVCLGFLEVVSMIEFNVVLIYLHGTASYQPCNTVDLDPATARLEAAAQSVRTCVQRSSTDLGLRRLTMRCRYRAR